MNIQIIGKVVYVVYLGEQSDALDALIENTAAANGGIPTDARDQGLPSRCFEFATESVKQAATLAAALKKVMSQTQWDLRAVARRRHLALRYEGLNPRLNRRIREFIAANGGTVVTYTESRTKKQHAVAFEAVMPTAKAAAKAAQIMSHRVYQIGPRGRTKAA